MNGRESGVSEVTMDYNVFESSSNIVVFYLVFNQKHEQTSLHIQSYSSSPSFSHSSKSSKCCLRCSTVYSLTSPCRIISSISTLPSMSTLPATGLSQIAFGFLQQIIPQKQKIYRYLQTSVQLCNYESVPISGPEEVVLRFNACDWIP